MVVAEHLINFIDCFDFLSFYLNESSSELFGILFILFFQISDYLKKQMPQAEAAGLKDMPEQDKLVEDIFQHEDRDRNGFISHEEFSGPKHDEL